MLTTKPVFSSARKWQMVSRAYMIFFFFKQKTAYEIFTLLEFRRVLFRSGGVLVLERLPLHHVAPVAGGVADREQDRLVLLARLGQRLGTPREPVDRVVGVLQQVRAGRSGQPVGPARLALAHRPSVPRQAVVSNRRRRRPRTAASPRQGPRPRPERGAVKI